MAAAKRSSKRFVPSRSLGGDDGLVLDPEDEMKLYCAIDLNETALLRMLLEAGGIDARSRFPGHLSKSALQLCCEKGRLECAQILLEAGANTEAQDDWFHTPLVSSVSTGRRDMVKLLVNAGCNTEMKDKFGKTAMHYAVNGCETGCLAELIEASADVNALDQAGRAPVWLAAETDGRTEYIQMLVDAHCDVSIKDKREKRAPLQVAILKANVDLVSYVKMLLDAGAETDVVDLLGLSPMTCLIHRVSAANKSRQEVFDVDERHMDVARLLLDAGYDVNFTSSAHYSFQFHGTSLKMAVDRGVVPIVQLLLDYGADPDASDDKNATPLHLAVCHDFRFIGKRLIRANCAPDRQAEVTLSGHVMPFATPFACAVVLERVEFVELFLASGYDVRDEPHSSYDDFVTSAWGVTSSVTSLERGLLADTLFHCYGNPRRLCDVTRSLIRRLLGKGIEKKVAAMTLPIGVKRNILLLDLLGS